MSTTFLYALVHHAESLEKAIEGRLDIEKKLQETLVAKDEAEARAKKEKEHFEDLIANLEKQNADIEANLIGQADAFRAERTQLEENIATLQRDLESRVVALTDLEAKYSTLSQQHSELQESAKLLTAKIEELVPLPSRTVPRWLTHVPHRNKGILQRKHKLKWKR